MSLSAGRSVVGQDVLNETFEGLQSEIVPLVEMIGRKVTVSDIAGDLFVEKSLTGLAQAGDPIAIGADANVEEMDFTQVAYKCQRYYGYGVLPDAVAQSLTQAYDYDALQNAARTCRQAAVAKLNKKLNTTIVSTTLNTEKAATDWGATAGTPILDIQAGARSTGKGDTMFLGDDVANALARHPDLKEGYSNYSGDGAIPESALVNSLRGVFPHIKTVIIGSALYNTANPGQSTSLGYQFDGTAWLGHMKDLVYAFHGESSEEDRIVKRQAQEIYYEILADIVRPHPEMGTVFTFSSLTTS